MLSRNNKKKNLCLDSVNKKNFKKYVNIISLWEKLLEALKIKMI